MDGWIDRWMDECMNKYSLPDEGVPSILIIVDNVFPLVVFSL